MIIDSKKSDVIVSGEVKKSAFSIQASAKAFEILSSNIYSNKIRAVIREVSCNAHDAHVAANNPNPFKVHLPTTLEPWFSVRDYGLGLSDDDIRQVYTTYFFSTKTDSNDYIGALGLGSKSPFCLVDSFTVTSYFNGVKRVYSCFKSEDGEPSIALLTQENTTEPNGLNVSVDVNNLDYSEFIDEAVNVYKYFTNVPDINLKSVYDTIANYHKAIVVKTKNVRSSLKRGELVALMGNVAYEIPSNYNNLWIHGELLFDIGDLSFDPGRENLSMDQKTIANIKAKINLVVQDILEAVEQEVESKPTNFEKYATAYSFVVIHSGNGDVAKKCRDLYNKYEVKTSTGFVYYKPTVRGSSSKETSNGCLPTKDVVYFEYKKGYTQRITQFVRENRITAVLLTPEQIVETGIPASLIKDPSSLPKQQRNYTSVKKGNFYIYKNGTFTECTSIPVEDKIYVRILRNEPVGISKYSLIEKIKNLKELGVLDKDEVIYGVKAAVCVHNKKFVNDNSWIDLNQFIKEATESFKDKVFINEHPNMEKLYNISHFIDTEEFDNLRKLRNDFVRQRGDKLILDNLRVEYKKDHSLEHLVEEIYDKYPMLKFVSWPGDYKTEIKNYIELVSGVVSV